MFEITLNLLIKIKYSQERLLIDSGNAKYYKIFIIKHI